MHVLEYTALSLGYLTSAKTGGISHRATSHRPYLMKHILRLQLGGHEVHSTLLEIYYVGYKTLFLKSPT